MYKQIAIALLIAAPLVADLAARHTRAPDASMVPANATEVGPPPSRPAPAMPVQAQQTAALAPMQQPQPNLTGGIDPTPALDPSPAGETVQPAPPPPGPPTPVMQSATTASPSAPAITVQPPPPPPAF